MLLFCSCNRNETVEKNIEYEKVKKNIAYEKANPNMEYEEHTGEFMNSFGKAVIGMSINKFNSEFKQNLKDTILARYKGNNIDDYTQGFKELDIEKNIKLKNVTVQFINGKLRRIESHYHKTLFDTLHKKYGGTLKKKNYLFFLSDSVNIWCEYSNTGFQLKTVSRNGSGEKVLPPN